MALIIGLRFKDGVVLIADRKITENNGKFSYGDKIKLPFGTALGFAAAGFEHKFKQFNRRIVEIVGEKQRQFQIKNQIYFRKHELEPVEKTAKQSKKQLSNKDIESANSQSVPKLELKYFEYTI